MVSRLYLAGPMRGYPRYNFDAFVAACRDLRGRGFTVISPHEMDLELGFDPEDEFTQADLEKAIPRDVEGILKSEAVVLLPGWEDSKGAQTELSIALWAGRKAMLYPHLATLDTGLTKICQVQGDVLEEALSITKQARNQDYGPPQEDFEKQARMWSVILGIEVKPHQIAMCMMASKLCRATVSPEKRDHWVDLAGYARCGWMCVDGDSATS